jgi:DNA-binding NarL/FixJ family response regulator
MIRIAITDDHTLFRKSLTLLVGSFDQMEVVVEASNGIELLEQLISVPVDILLLDLQMPEMDGFLTCKKIIELYPEIKILVLTHLSENDIIRKVIELGVHGYFTKNTDPAELNNALLRLQEDGFYFEKSLTTIIEYILNTTSLPVKKINPIVFTCREKEIIELTLKEYSGLAIAEQLFISPKTVEKHKRNMMEKTGSQNFVGVITFALLNGLLTLEEIKQIKLL